MLRAMSAMETIIALAKEQGISPNSFKKWKARKCVPHRYRHDMLTLAGKKGAVLTAADLDWRRSANGRSVNGRSIKRARAAA